MVLKMTQPFKHPVTGNYYFRKRVPKDLIPLVGKREEKISLSTRDPREAKVLHAGISAEVEARWAQLRRGRVALTHKQALAIAGEIYRERIRQYEDEPARANPYDLILESLVKPRSITTMYAGADREKTKRFHQMLLERAAMPSEIDEFLKRRGMLLDDDSLEKVRKAVLASKHQANLQLRRFVEGDYRPDPLSERFPNSEIASQPAQNHTGTDSEKYLITTIFDDYAREKEIAPASYKRWKPIIAKVAAEVPDARDLTKQWCIDWKDKLVNQGLKKSTVREAYLAALRAACAWGVANNRLPSNPVDGVTVAVPKKIKTRSSHFTDVEALTILRATLEPQSERMSDQMRGAFRWLPWLCAYSGARVGEIAQLRKQDIQRHDGVWLMWITPEAGSTKNGAPRFVAIHPHLVEQGFLDFVKRSKNNTPLFYDPARSRGGRDGNPQYKKVGERIAAWVREIGVDDEQIQPNHAWRHLFKTRARKVKMDVGAREYMQGHVPSTEGEAYGEFEPDVLAYEVGKLPRFVT